MLGLHTTCHLLSTVMAVGIARMELQFQMFRFKFRASNINGRLTMAPLF